MADDDNKGDDSAKLLYCSFCGKSQHEVRKLIAGPSVFICDECVELCNDIIREEVQESAFAAAGLTDGHADAFIEWLSANIEQLRPISEEEDEWFKEQSGLIVKLVEENFDYFSPEEDEALSICNDSMQYWLEKQNIKRAMWETKNTLKILLNIIE
jgi:hypothetical protein